MKCEEVRPKLSWSIDRELDDAVDGEVRRHLEGCASCAALFSEMVRCEGEVRGVLEELVPSTGFPRRVVERATGRRSAWIRRLSLAAGILVMLVAGSAVYVNTLKPPPLLVAVHGGESFHPDSLGALRVFVTNAAANMPLAGCAVRILLAGTEVGRYLTGAAGTIDGSFHVPDLPDGTYPLRLEIDTLIGRETLERSIAVKREYRLLLTTDKPMYQPGQTVRMRALALHSFTLKPRSGDAELEVLDSRGNKVFTQKIVLSDFGIGSAEMPLADEVNLGTWRVAVTAAGLRQERTVEVAKYALPKFKVDLAFDKESYRPGETVRGTVKAGYFFGKPVNGRVKASVGREIVSGDLRKDGTWEFQAPAPEEGTAKVEVSVTDTADHRETKTSALTVSREPLKAILYPEGGTIVRGVENTFYVIVSTPDGRPVKAELSLIVNGRAWEASTDDLGVARVAAAEPYEIKLTQACDKAGNETRRMDFVGEHYGVNDFLVRLDKASYKAGETMTVTVLGGGEGPFYVDLVKNGRLLSAKAVEKGELAFDLPPDLFGMVQVIAYKRNSPHPVVRVAYVNLPDGLRIRSHVAKESFRPGEEMPVEFEVLDKDGKPVQAALGISVVDEALYGLVESKPASEKAWFSMAPELVETRGFLRADVNEIYDAGNTNAQRFVCGNAKPNSLTRILENAYELRAHEVRRFIKKFNKALVTVAKVTAIVLGILAVLVFGVRIVRWLDSMRLLGVALIAFLFLVLVPLLIPSVARSSKSLRMYVGESVPAKPLSELPLPTPFRSDETERIREYFPETLFWRPELITDERGRARLTLPAADSITSWRMLASGVARNGALGSERANLKVFQDFFVDIDFPVALTKGDRIHVPVAIYSYLKEPQTVTVRVQREAWFELLDEESKTLALKSDEVSVVYFGLKVKEHGRKSLTVFADGKVKDAIRRTVDIFEKGREIPVSASERIGNRHTFRIEIPDRAIEGTSVLFARLTPGSGDLVTGLEGMIQMPYG